MQCQTSITLVSLAALCLDAAVPNSARTEPGYLCTHWVERTLRDGDNAGPLVCSCTQPTRLMSCPIPASQLSRHKKKHRRSPRLVKDAVDADGDVGGDVAAGVGEVEDGEWGEALALAYICWLSMWRKFVCVCVCSRRARW
jgi:hypothetical protein